MNKLWHFYILFLPFPSPLAFLIRIQQWRARPERGFTGRKCQGCAQTDGGQGVQIKLPRKAVKINRDSSLHQAKQYFLQLVSCFGAMGLNCSISGCWREQTDKFLSHFSWQIKHYVLGLCVWIMLLFRLIDIFPRILCKPSWSLVTSQSLEGWVWSSPP